MTTLIAGNVANSMAVEMLKVRSGIENAVNDVTIAGNQETQPNDQITLRIDAPEAAGTPRSGPWLNVRNFSTPQAAIAAAPDGSTVFFPPGTYGLPGELNLPRDKRIRLLGAGVGSTILELQASAPFGAIRVQGDGQAIEGLTLKGGVNGTLGIVVGRPEILDDPLNVPVRGVRIERCLVEEFESVGLHLGEAYIGGYPAQDGVVTDVWIKHASSDGVALKVTVESWNWVFERLRTTVLYGDHVIAEDTEQLEWRDCRLETELGGVRTGQVLLKNCRFVRFVNCRLEDHTAGGSTVMPILALRGQYNHEVTVDSCRFVRDEISDVEEITVSTTPEEGDDIVQGLLIVNPIFEKQRASPPNVPNLQREIYVKSALSECQVIGGIVRSGSQISDIQVEIAASRSSLLGTGSRARLPQLTSVQIGNLVTAVGTQVLPGDLVFDTTAGRLKMAVEIQDPPYVEFKVLLVEGDQ